jgi:hypothetical protein
VAVDSSGNVFVADQFGLVIREIDTLGNINTFSADANFGGIETMVLDSENNLYAAYTGACVIWKITHAAVVTAGLASTEPAVITATHLSNHRYRIILARSTPEATST